MNEKAFMARAFVLARRGSGRVHPNPMVGAVLVRNGKVVSEGYHHGFGQDHAEVDAIKRARGKASGSTLFVNLEPCSHWGKTPPCVIAIAGAGIRTVVAAMRDPNPSVSGKGFSFLRRHGVGVRHGVLEAEAKDLNRAFVTWMSERRPYVTLKAAVSLDGKIATAQGESRWITSPPARALGHALRAEVEAIAVGIGTALKDNPSLTTHGKGRNPKRIVFDSTLRLPVRGHLLDKSAPTWIFTTSRASSAKRRALERKGASVYVLPENKDGDLALPEAMRVLAREGIAHLLVEGGGSLNAAFLQAGLVDEVIWFIAPKLIGGADAKTAVEGKGVKKLADAWQLKDIEFKLVGTDLMIKGRLR